MAVVRSRKRTQRTRRKKKGRRKGRRMGWRMANAEQTLKMGGQALAGLELGWSHTAKHMTPSCRTPGGLSPNSTIHPQEDLKPHRL